MVGSKRADDDHHKLYRHRSLSRDGHMMDCPDRGDCDIDAAEALRSLEVSCSICLEVVSDNGGRSRAKLQCGHEFHLDCIGSAFNMKGAMQCPNCRTVEKGQWLYANGTTRSLPELGMDDWLPDEDFYGLSYPEMPFGVWCPFGEFAQVGSSYEELEYPSSQYHDIRAQHATFAEHAVGPSMAHSYFAYVGAIPVPPLTSSDSIEDSSMNHQWDGISGRTETFNPHASSALNVQYHGWGRHSAPFAVASSHSTGVEPVAATSASRRSHAENDATIRRRSYQHPFLFGYRSSPRTGSLGGPRRSGSSAPTHESVHHHHHAFHHQASTAPVTPSHVIRRIVPVPPPPAPPPDQIGSFFVLPPAPSSQNMHEPERDHFQSWEGEWLSPFPVAPRDSGWRIHPNAATSSSEFANRSTRYWHRHLAYYSS